MMKRKAAQLAEVKIKCSAFMSSPMPIRTSRTSQLPRAPESSALSKPSSRSVCTNENTDKRSVSSQSTNSNQKHHNTSDSPGRRGAASTRSNSEKSTPISKRRRSESDDDLGNSGVKKRPGIVDSKLESQGTVPGVEDNSSDKSDAESEIVDNDKGNPKDSKKNQQEKTSRGLRSITTVEAKKSGSSQSRQKSRKESTVKSTDNTVVDSLPVSSSNGQQHKKEQSVTPSQSSRIVELAPKTESLDAGKIPSQSLNDKQKLGTGSTSTKAVKAVEQGSSASGTEEISGDESDCIAESESDCSKRSSREKSNSKTVEEDAKKSSDSDDECIVISSIKGKPQTNMAGNFIPPPSAISRGNPTKTVGMSALNLSSFSASSSSQQQAPSMISLVKFAASGASGLSKQQAQLLMQKVFELETTISNLKKEFAHELEKKDAEIRKIQENEHDEIIRLKNQINWKDDQINELSKAAEKNTELEAKINRMLSSKEEYEEEVTKALEERNKPTDDGAESEGETSSDNESGEDVELCPKTGRRKRQGRTGKKASKKNKDECHDADDIELLFVGKSESLPKVDDIPETPLNQPVTSTSSLSSMASSLPAKFPIPTSSLSSFSAMSNPQLSRVEQLAEDDKDALLTKGRHDIRRLVGRLQEETKVAGRLEAERRERVKKQRDKHVVEMGVDPSTKQPICSRLVLAFEDDDCKKPLVQVNSKLLAKLKPHQVEAVEFLWDAVVESVDALKSEDAGVAEGGGCILAHCMGLGKTLSVVTFIHTMLSCPSLGFNSCLVLAPLNTVLNWVFEWGKWLGKKNPIKIYELTSIRQASERIETLNKWKKTGGVLVMGYQLFRLLANYSGKSKKTKQTYASCLIDPGADLIVCDEGHVLKNDASALSKCVNNVRSKRRVVLTGTPLQNNLIEYHCMVSFVKPNLLGSRREFCNRFVNPISNGQHSDSTPSDVQLMKRRAHVLHEMLAGCVQRRDYSALVKFLPPKHEYVISVRLSPLQIDLYQQYLDKFTSLSESAAATDAPDAPKFQCSGLFSDYQNLMRIWTHPWVLKLDEIRQEKKPLTLSDDDELESIMYTSSSEGENAIGVESDTSTEATSGDEDDSDSSEDAVGDSDASVSSKDATASAAAPAKRPLRINLRKQKNKAPNGKASNLSSKNAVNSGDDDDVRVPSRKKVANGKNKKSKKVVSSSSADEIVDEDESNSQEGSERKSATGKKSSKTSRKRISSAPLHMQQQNVTKILGGEVIRPWQTRTRSRGFDPLPDVDWTAAKREEQWWTKFVKEEDKTRIELSGKLVLLFEILSMSQQLGDKVLVFSQSLLSLDLIEDFLQFKTEQANQHNSSLDEKEKKKSVWVKDEDYVRMDGSTGAQSRKKFTSNFNDASNERLRLFLISTKAGGLGINLDCANRVVIFDASWNPSHDVQSIFRVYRFGQQKNVYVYRLLAQGTMEEKIYERQVTKETLSQRVIDEHQIDRHFSAADLRELYVFKPDRLDDPDAPKRPIPAVPKDVVLAELLSSQQFSPWIVQYHEHDSLLENRPEENLTEDERRAAWDEYEREKTGMYVSAATAAPQTTAWNIPPGAVLQHYLPSGLRFPPIDNAAFPTYSSNAFLNRFPPAAVMGPNSWFAALRAGLPPMPTSTSHDMTVGTTARPILIPPPKSSQPTDLSAKPSYIKLSQLGVKTTLSQEDLDAAVNYALGQIPSYQHERFGFQVQQLPKVMLEIFKYNPTISAENLKKRLSAFLGMHSRSMDGGSTGGLHGHANSQISTR